MGEMEKENRVQNHPDFRKQYVRYLNRPKRARHDGLPLDVVKDISLCTKLSNTMENSHLPTSEQCQDIVDKTNLSVEMNFKVSKIRKRVKCGCAYRKHLCLVHKQSKENLSFIHLSKQTVLDPKIEKRQTEFKVNVPEIPKKQYLSDNCRTFSKNCVKISKERLLKYRMLEHRLMHRRLRRLTQNSNSSYEETKSQFSRPELQLNLQPFPNVKRAAMKTQTSEVCVVEADVICQCKRIPNSACFSTFGLYKRACHMFCTRHLLSTSLVAVYSSSSSRKRKSLHDKQTPLSLPYFIKDSVVLWCKDLISSNKFLAGKGKTCKVELEQKVFPYSYFPQRHCANRIGREELDILNAAQLADMAPCKYSMHRTTSNHKCQDSKSPPVVEQNENKSSSTDQLFVNDLETQSNSPSDCIDEEYQNLTTAEFNPSIVRISSRLKKKRDSGVQAPYGDDFIVEVPTCSKKTKKLKPIHPYSHELFWNFYSNSKSSERYKWKLLARTYFKMLQSNMDTEENLIFGLQCSTSKLPKREFSWNDISGPTTKDDVNTKDTSCCFCGTSYAGWSIEDRTAHSRRHKSLWSSFTSPIFLPRNLVVKQRPIVDKDNGKSTLLKSPVKPPPRTPPPRFVSFSRNHRTLTNRATARKSNIAW